MIVGMLITYIILAVLSGICVFGCMMIIIFERQEREYGHVILGAFLLLALVIVFVCLTNEVFELGMFDVFNAWITSEI